jgi:hypothetical protein
MLKDIPNTKVENVAIAVIHEGEDWNVYLINLSETDLKNVLVSSKGYITHEDGSQTKTSELRHALGDVSAKSYAKVEPIIENVFGLHNQYWVSFFVNEEMLDKKYIFLAETIKKENFVNIPIINKKGVMIL